jgi:hypothetical protein
MPVWLPVVLQHWKPIAVALGIVAALVYRGVLVAQRDSARAEVKALTERVAELDARGRACEEAVRRQNAVVASMRDAALRELRAAETRQANVSAKAARAAASDARRAAELRHARFASGCDAAIRWGNEQARELGSWTESADAP